MTSTFAGFSEDDLRRIKGVDIVVNSATKTNIDPPPDNARKISKIGAKPQRKVTSKIQPFTQASDDYETKFDKCRLSLKTTDDFLNNNKDKDDVQPNLEDHNHEPIVPDEEAKVTDNVNEKTNVESRKSSAVVAPDIVRCVDNYTENDHLEHKAKIEGLQLKQKLMEEQNKKRKEMLAKALADRTKQTEEEVQKLEKIKKELNVLDGQLSQDVAVLRKKIDQACFTYADAEKHYLKVEKEFLQAKINLQKEKEKKELLTEHLCALITHNESRKAQKLETLMLQLAIDKNQEVSNDLRSPSPLDENAVIIDGVDQKTGQMVEFNG